MRTPLSLPHSVPHQPTTDTIPQLGQTGRVMLHAAVCCWCLLMRQYITLSAFAYVNQDYVRQGAWTEGESFLSERIGILDVRWMVRNSGMMRMYE
jgi:hypothetical protein